MQDISKKALDLIHTGRPEFPEMVRLARERARGNRKAVWLPLSLEEFEDDPFLLYACLWYLYCERVEARMTPKRP